MRKSPTASRARQTRAMFKKDIANIKSTVKNVVKKVTKK